MYRLAKLFEHPRKSDALSIKQQQQQQQQQQKPPPPPPVVVLYYYTVFQKNGHPFYFFHNSLKWWSIYTKFLPDVAEEMLIQNIWTKYGC